MIEETAIDATARGCLEAVRTFAGNVLRRGSDVYGPKHTPLLVDGVNVDTDEPAAWLNNGETWYLSNLAGQQHLVRVLDGLTALTGDPRYVDAATTAIRYTFDNLRSESGLLLWGGHVAYDALGDRTVEERHSHELKSHYPYYDLMWRVNPEATKRYVEAMWEAHILDWSTLDMNRHGSYEARVDPERGPWHRDYAGGPVFFVGKGLTFCNTGSDLVCAAALLHHFTGEEGPLVWAKRMAHRFVETRNPGTGLGGYQYSRIANDRAAAQFGPEFGEKALEGTILDRGHATLRYAVMGIAELQLGEILGATGGEFLQWAAEDLAAYARHAYDPQTNTFRALFSDGTPLTPADLKRPGYYKKPAFFAPWPPAGAHLWAYALAARLTGDRVHWQTAREIARGFGLGDIGEAPTNSAGRRLSAATAATDPHVLLAVLELHRATDDDALLALAATVAGNLLAAQFHNGFFLPTADHLYAQFGAVEPLALLRFAATAQRRPDAVPVVWPADPYFQAPHDGLGRSRDTDVIYTRLHSGA